MSKRLPSPLPVEYFLPSKRPNLGVEALRGWGVEGFEDSSDQLDLPLVHSVSLNERRVFGELDLEKSPKGLSFILPVFEWPSPYFSLDIHTGVSSLNVSIVPKDFEASQLSSASKAEVSLVFHWPGGDESPKYCVSFSGSQLLSGTKLSAGVGGVEALRGGVVEASVVFSGIRPRGEKLPGGLVNLGTTCYLASFLQVVFHLRGLRREIFEVRERASTAGGLVSSSGERLEGPLFELQKLLLEMEVGGSEEDRLSPSSLVRALEWSPERLAQQQDVQEFSLYFLDFLEGVFRAGGRTPPPTDKIFGGKLRTEIRGLENPVRSEKEEGFLMLSLPVKNCQNLEESIKRFFKEEVLEGENAVELEGLPPQKAIKKVKLASFPPLLALHLNRFEINHHLGVATKVTDPLEFPEILDSHLLGEETEITPQHLNGSTPACNGKAESGSLSSYELYAVISHFGRSASSGHYKAYIRTGGSWTEFDDERVSPVSWSFVRDNCFGHRREFFVSEGRLRENLVASPGQAYMLYYIRRGEVANLLRGDGGEAPYYVVEACRPRVERRVAASRIQVFVTPAESLIGGWGSLRSVFPCEAVMDRNASFRFRMGAEGVFTVPRGCGVEGLRGRVRLEMGEEGHRALFAFNPTLRRMQTVSNDTILHLRESTDLCLISVPTTPDTEEPALLWVLEPCRALNRFRILHCLSTNPNSPLGTTLSQLFPPTPQPLNPSPRKFFTETISGKLEEIGPERLSLPLIDSSGLGDLKALCIITSLPTICSEETLRLMVRAPIESVDVQLIFEETLKYFRLGIGDSVEALLGFVEKSFGFSEGEYVICKAASSDDPLDIKDRKQPWRNIASLKYIVKRIEVVKNGEVHKSTETYHEHKTNGINGGIEGKEEINNTPTPQPLSSNGHSTCHNTSTPQPSNSHNLPTPQPSALSVRSGVGNDVCLSKSITLVLQKLSGEFETLLSSSHPTKTSLSTLISPSDFTSRLLRVQTRESNYLSFNSLPFCIDHPLFFVRVGHNFVEINQHSLVQPNTQITLSPSLRLGTQGPFLQTSIEFEALNRRLLAPVKVALPIDFPLPEYISHLKRLISSMVVLDSSGQPLPSEAIESCLRLSLITPRGQVSLEDFKSELVGGLPRNPHDIQIVAKLIL